MLKNYIEIVPEIIDGGYIINRYFLVTEEERYRIGGRNEKIIREILKNFDYERGPNNSKRYAQLEEIMNLFESVVKERNSRILKQRKVNRKKSRSIQVVIFGLSVVAMTGLFSSFGGKKNKGDLSHKATATISDAVDSDDQYIVEIGENNSDDMKKKSQEVGNIVDNGIGSIEEFDEDTLLFEYESDESVDKENINNALKHEEIFKKYGEMYGISWEVLCAIAAQENAGIHDIDYSDSALGIMQIERGAWLNKNIEAYNYNTGEVDKLFITNENLEDMATNIRVATMILQNNISKTVKYGYLEGKIEANEILAYAIQRYNMGGGTMASLLGMGGNWQDNRTVVSLGDNRYFEKIFAGLEHLECSNICIKNYDSETGEIREFKFNIENTLNKQLSK